MLKSSLRHPPALRAKQGLGSLQVTFNTLCNAECTTHKIPQSQALGSEYEMLDGERLPLAVKDLGSSDLYPQSLQHNPNGRFVTVCGDGEFVVYTALAWRNESFGQVCSCACVCVYSCVLYCTVHATLNLIDLHGQ